MDRLTDRFKGVGMDEPEIMHNGHRWGPAFFPGDGYKEYDAILDRLAAYEDTGLEPDEIQHWIPVSEGLPKNTVIGCDKWGNVEPVLYIAPIKKWKIMPNASVTMEVTHWMPLPKPPKATEITIKSREKASKAKNEQGAGA